MKQFIIIYLVILMLFSCKKIAEDNKEYGGIKSTISINSVKGVSRHSATIDAVITLKENDKVLTKGICFSTTPIPTIFDNKIENLLTISPYTCAISGLVPNSTYYVRAFLTTSSGVVYSDPSTFQTLPISIPVPVANPIVLTTTLFGTIVQASVTDDGGAKVVEKGFCWSTTTNPTISNTTQSIASSEFKLPLSNLVANTTYYIRPYAMNSIGIAYGEQIIIVVDIEGNIYNTVKIGTQLWLKENLKTTILNDGTPLKNVTENCEWGCITIGIPGQAPRIKPPAYCWYDNDISNKTVYGAMYNGKAVKTGLLAPKGWHVPKHQEFGILFHFLDPKTQERITSPPWGVSFIDYYTLYAANKMLIRGGAYWDYTKFPDYVNFATNESGFSAVGSGERETLAGTFIYKNVLAGFWGSTEYDTDKLFRYVFAAGNPYNGIFHGPEEVGIGWAVRCLKDVEN